MNHLEFYYFAGASAVIMFTITKSLSILTVIILTTCLATGSASLAYLIRSPSTNDLVISILSLLQFNIPMYFSSSVEAVSSDICCKYLV